MSSLISNRTIQNETAVSSLLAQLAKMKSNERTYSVRVWGSGYSHGLLEMGRISAFLLEVLWQFLTMFV